MSADEDADVTPQQAKDAASSGDAVLLDCREEWEWRGGHAEDAVHIPMRAVPGALEQIKDRRVHVVCYSGARSGQVARWLRAQGVDAGNVIGGMKRWVEEGLPIDGELVH